MELFKHKELALKLRTCRALATTLRAELEEAESLATALVDVTESYDIDIGEAASNAGNIEDFLDLLKINEDGTSAAEGFGE